MVTEIALGIIHREKTASSSIPSPSESSRRLSLNKDRLWMNKEGLLKEERRPKPPFLFTL